MSAKVHIQRAGQGVDNLLPDPLAVLGREAEEIGSVAADDVTTMKRPPPPGAAMTPGSLLRLSGLGTSEAAAAAAGEETSQTR